MNRQRLTALLMATAVLAGISGLLNGGGCQIMSRTWADGAPAATLAAKPHHHGTGHGAPQPKRTKVKVVVTHGRTWT